MSDRNKFVLIGAIAGLVLGATAAYAYYEQQAGGLWTQKRLSGRKVQVQAGMGDFFRIGLNMLGLVRSVQGMVKNP